jgi:hypothetical protein
MNELQAIENALISGDLTSLTTQQRVQYYNRICESLGLNPLTRPFDYIRLNGKLTLYARKDATDQLRKLHKVNIKITETKIEHGIFMVTVEASSGDRLDTDLGAISLHGLKGDDLSNAMMKTITKAKRRVTLSICGLGLSDESEVVTIPGAEILKEEPKMAQVEPKMSIQNMPINKIENNSSIKPAETIKPRITKSPPIVPVQPNNNISYNKMATHLDLDELQFDDELSRMQIKTRSDNAQ